jgi:hypothetical protein
MRSHETTTASDELREATTNGNTNEKSTTETTNDKRHGSRRAGKQRRRTATPKTLNDSREGHDTVNGHTEARVPATREHTTTRNAGYTTMRNAEHTTTRNDTTR